MADPPSGTVALLFTDIEGSTRLLQRAGDAYGELLDQHRRLLRTAFEEYGGYEVDTQGDAFFVAFNSATDAVAAAAEAQLKLAAQRWPADSEVRVRIGVHSGEPRLIGRSYVGLDVHKGARVMSAAHGGQVLITKRVRDQLDQSLKVRDLGEHRLKDLLQPEHLFQLQIDGLTSDFPALKTLGNRPTNLPIQPNALIGRGRELDEVMDLLRREGVRQLTLVGPGGTGKTRLALQVGAELLDEFRSGVFFISLASTRDPEFVAPAIAQTLAVGEVPGEQLLDTLATYLEDKEMLLLVDNFEQVVSAGPVLGELIARCAKLSLIVTSRERLRLSCERAYEVPPLRLPEEARDGWQGLLRNESIALFVARAQAARSSFTLSKDDALAAAEICRRLDGLPLAIELAAARVSVLTPSALLARLGERLELLTGGPRDADERQQTLRKTIEWSYDLLSGSERVLFSRLSVFGGGCRYEAARAICGFDGDAGNVVLDGLQGLIAKSLLRQTLHPDGEPRFWMLETIREFALERLAASSDADALRQYHAEYFMHLAEEAKDGVRGPKQAGWFTKLEDEHDNFRIALSWLVERPNGEAAIRAMSGLWVFWAMCGHSEEGIAWIERTLASARDAPPQVRAEGAAIAGELHRVRQQYDRAKTFHQEALALCESLGNRRDVAYHLHDLGQIAFKQGDYEQARTLHERSLALRDPDDRREVAHALTGLAELALHEADYERAADLFTQILATGQEVGRTDMAVVSLAGLGEISKRQGDNQQADSLLREALTAAWKGGYLYYVCSLLDTIARLRAAGGDGLGAARLWGAADKLSASVGAKVEDEDDYEGCVADARSRIPESDFEDAWVEGSRWDAAAAVAYALGVRDPIAGATLRAS